MKLISWNIAHRKDAWRYLINTDADVALLQEANAPPPDVASQIRSDGKEWKTFGTDGVRPWRSAIVQLSERAKINWLKSNTLEKADASDFRVSRRGTISAAQIETPIGKVTLVSMYGLWERPHTYAKSNWIYADASVHRLISDIAGLIGNQTNHKIIASGDLNILFGYGESGSKYWANRYDTVFKRMEAMGMLFVGPQHPNGRLADPWPSELPVESKNVPTYHNTNSTPKQAYRQLDFVFASECLRNHVRVTALNKPKDWGPSDHCRIVIDIT